MSEHTQTPWFVVRNDDGDLSLGTSLDDPWYIADMCRGCDGDGVEVDPAEANAAFIVKAVNSHNALVKVVSDILDVWSGYATPEMDAAITIMQTIGLDRWSMQASMERSTINANVPQTFVVVGSPREQNG